MKLGTLIEQLSYGELKDLHLGAGGKGKVPPQMRNKLISYINTAMRLIYTEFPLKTCEVIVGLRDDVSIYTLSSEYAKSNTDSDIPIEYRYIEDTLVNKFADDILRIDEVFSINGITQDVNNMASAFGVNVLNYNQIQVAMPKRGEKLSIVYTGLPKEICKCACDDTEVEVPPTFWEMLRAFVAYTAYSGMSTQTAGQKANEFIQKYEALKLIAKEKNVLNSFNTPYNTRFERGGFV